MFGDRVDTDNAEVVREEGQKAARHGTLRSKALELESGHQSLTPPHANCGRTIVHRASTEAFCFGKETAAIAAAARERAACRLGLKHGSSDFSRKDDPNQSRRDNGQADLTRK
ncbi:hypothetical protein MOX02_54050 [Methylobacterium oxalidis]|uniref:Uncharacterized protein n=1 Tax=Methylobacterium oxalidis TaxID=944322 RepID=A0A512JBN0_9HYPH|nr:hypothetical protein MOX02_54050 [Methylobacterium oxalidis]GLS64477.1 hypothetical protein GCM10007888_28580 [Methylobacterium oxalidis]